MADSVEACKYAVQQILIIYRHVKFLASLRIPYKLPLCSIDSII